jgi:hypothetical protein
MKEFRLKEISAVDRPAQTPAQVAIMKRATPDSGESNSGHVANPLPKDAAKSGDTDMTDKTVEKSAELLAAEAKISELSKSLEQANLLASLTDADRAHLDTLSGDARGEFLGKSADQRAAVLAEIAKADPVVFKSADGTEFRKSDDPRLIEMAKRADRLAQDLEKREALAKRADLEKRAVALKNLPGDLDVHCALLAAVDSIADEALRKSALEALKASDAGVSKASQEIGVSGHDAAASGSAEEQLDSLAKRFASENKVTYEKAYTEVCKTKEGRDLVFEMRGQRDKS